MNQESQNFEFEAPMSDYLRWVEHEKARKRATSQLADLMHEFLARRNKMNMSAYGAGSEMIVLMEDIKRHFGDFRFKIVGLPEGTRSIQDDKYVEHELPGVYVADDVVATLPRKLILFNSEEDTHLYVDDMAGLSVEAMSVPFEQFPQASDEEE